jgi:hypothetical protein
MPKKRKMGRSFRLDQGGRDDFKGMIFNII